MKLKYTKPQILLEIASAAVLAGMLVHFFVLYSIAPDTLPMHYDFAGNIDRYGDKSEILFMPILAAALYAGLTAVSFFPGIWNIPVTLTEQNKTAVLGTARILLILLKTEAIAVFWYLSNCSLTGQSTSPAFLPIELALLAATLVICIICIVRAGKSK